MLSELLQGSVLIGILYSGIRLAAPYLFAALGETVSQRAGVLDLGVDGIMLMGSFVAFYVVFKTGNLWLGVAASIGVGILMGLLMAVISVTFQAEQGISGIGLYLFGLGLSSLLFRTMIGSVKGITSFQPLRIPVLSDIPVIGEIFFNHNILIYMAYVMVPVIWFIFGKTTLGLKIRAVGQNPEAADSLGVNVNRVRYFGVIFGAAMAGVAGATLSTGLMGVWQDNITNGIGFIAVALVYFGGGWRASSRAAWVRVQPARACAGARRSLTVAGRWVCCLAPCSSPLSTPSNFGSKSRASRSPLNWRSCCPTS